MKLIPLGSELLIIQQVEKKEDTGGFIVVGDSEPFYAKGRVERVGKACDGSSLLFKTVLYPVEKAKLVGLGFPDSFVLVNIEDVHGFINEEED